MGGQSSINLLCSFLITIRAEPIIAEDRPDVLLALAHLLVISNGLLENIE